MSDFEQEWCSVIGVFNQRPAQTKSSQQIIILNIFSIFLQYSQQIKVFKKIILFLKVVPKVIYLSNFLLRVVWAKLIAIMGNWHKNRILPQSIEFSFVKISANWVLFYLHKMEILSMLFQRVRLDEVANGNYLIIGQSTPEDSGVSQPFLLFVFCCTC